jgi:hypothetical protein
MDRDSHSISPRDLYERLGSEAAPVVVDVRRDTDFVGAETVVVPTPHHDRATFAVGAAMVPPPPRKRPNQERTQDHA